MRPNVENNTMYSEVCFNLDDIQPFKRYMLILRTKSHQVLLNHETEQNGVADFAKVLEDKSFQLGVFDDVLELMLVILEDAGRAVIEPGKFADWRHDIKQGGDVLQDGALQLSNKVESSRKFL